MATKPAITIVVRASDTLYSNGPPALVNTATKIARTTPQQNEGYLVDAPLNTFPVPAQAINFENNRTDLMLEWVTFGSETPDLDAHIVETDATGLASLGMLTTGSTSASSAGIVANPNTSTVAIECHSDANNDGGEFDSSFNTRSGLIVKSAGAAEGSGSDVGVMRVESLTGGANGAPRALHVEANTLVSAVEMVNTSAVGATLKCTAGPGNDSLELAGGPAIWGVAGATDGGQLGGIAGLFDSNDLSGSVALFRNQNASANGNIIVVEAPNRSIGLKVTQSGGLRAAVELESTDGGGGDAGAPLRLVPQTFAIAGESLQDGAMWHQSGTFTNGLGFGAEQHHPRFRGRNSRWTSWTQGPTCSLEKFESANFEGPDSEALFIVLDAEFPDRMTPLGAGFVIVEIDGYCRRQNNTADNPSIDGYEVRVEDFTATSTLIKSRTFDLVPIVASDSDNVIRSYFSIRTRYLLPAFGPRRFQVKAARTNPANSPLVIVNPTLRIRPDPSDLDEFG